MAGETVEDRLSRAQAGGDLEEIRAALEDARAAGADPRQIQAALAEIERLKGAGGAAATSGTPQAGGAGADLGAAAGGEDSAAAGEAEAAELRACAEAYKKRGNERLKSNTKSAAREALECFTSGLEVRCSDRVLNSQLYSNRAHVRMLLRRFVEAVDDCRKAIELDTKNVKAYWRAARASLHLDLCRNGIEFCEAGLRQEPKDADLVKLRDACAERLAGQQQRRSELAATAVSQTQAAQPQAIGEFNADEAMAVQEKVNSLNEQIEDLKMSIARKQREKMSAMLTRNSISETPVEARLFRSVGRCFLLQERGTVEEALDGAIGGLEAELPKLSNAHQELEKRREAAEKELKEMIDAFKRQSDPSPAGAA
mmetsp:Transcript_14803/g.40923  ORF Transcript_14803/g.40923 Transcript_14803/m.40923 type:complete len:370 (-) Transcript_14803:131-1240(-)